jgi:molecular chaperone HscB
MTDNYFDLLGMPQGFDINLQQLKSNNLRLQQTLHPDRFLHESTAQKMAAANKLAEVNEAFQSLKSGYNRGEYLLSLLGVKSADESLTVKNPALLMEQMELREELSEIRQLDDPEQKLVNFSERVKQLIKQQQNQLIELFNAVDFERKETDKTQLQLISDALIKLRFQQKLQQEIIRFEEQLDDY